MIMLVKRAFIFFNLTLLFLLATVQVTHASSPALDAKGAAIYEELGIEYYIASLYVEDSDAAGQNVAAYNGPQQINIKVTTKRWSARKWKAQWQNNIAINNAPSNDQELNEDLALFTEFPQGSLLRGDEVIVTYHPASGSELLFNGYSVFETQDKQFYSYLLNTWLGKFSPNRVFREKISGQEKLNLVLVQSSHQELDSERKRKTRTWFTANNTPSSGDSSVALLAANALKESQENELQQKKLKNADSQKSQQRLEGQKQQRKLQQEKEKAEKQRLAELQAKKKAEKEKQLKAEQEKKRRALKAKEAKKLKAEQQQAYYYDLYQWELATKVNETVSYPPWARQFNHQGTVDLTFTVNRSGVILEKTIAASDVSKILIQEVENKVKLAVELLAVPKDLKGDKWTFSIHYVFDLSNPEQEALLKPLAPF